MYKKVERNGTERWVREDLKDRQKEFCMCWDCHSFRPQDQDKGCPVIKAVLDLAAAKNVVLPVWECPMFQEK
ncbi:MAG: hypothetical protein V2A70_08240 [Candidatus Omnitrophota bacterium]